MLRENRNLSLLAAVLIGVLLLVLGLRAQGGSPESPAGPWRIARQNPSNTWSQPAEHEISPANVNDLRPKWVFTTGREVSAPPSVAGDIVYFPDWEGNLFAVKEQTEDLICSHKVSEYDGALGAISRVSPAGGLAATSITSRRALNPGNAFY
jgi:polyvinyl alcohol dehydrogenase (cytochrome)